MKTVKQFLTIILVTIGLNCGSSTSHYIFNFVSCVLKNEPPKVNTHIVLATMYYPAASQCDSTPLITANGSKINPTNASKQKWIAVSRDLLKADIHYGDFVKIEGAGYKDGIYQVMDTMHKRFKNRIDFLETTGTKQYKFTNVKLTKWNLPTLTESLLASL